MKSEAEIKSAHDLLADIVHDKLPVSMSAGDRKLLAIQCAVLCWVLEHQDEQSFHNSITSLGAILDHCCLSAKRRRIPKQQVHSLAE